MQPHDPASTPSARPALNCDIVMKGGITSGVVYPRAVSELAKRYRFRNIAGTSAGAIAAAATAAAEYRRLQGRGDEGFQELENLPPFLSRESETVRGSTLFALFQPDPRTLPLFSVATAGLEARSLAQRLLKTLPAALTNFAGSALLGLLIGGLLGLPGWFARTGGWRIGGPVAGVILALSGMALGVMAGIALNAVRELPRNRFGLCSGAPSPAYPAGTPALTPWMAELYNRIAGLPVPSADAAAGQPVKPLTFGDLWGTSAMPEPHETELQLMTTNLTHGRPHRLPYDTTRLYFKPAELREFFPGWVVDWMEQNPRKPSSPDGPSDARRAAVAAGFAPMPDPADLPVVVAARLSLSFPVLFSAIPLYAVDFASADPLPDRCWFSDGGLCSNFPVHFFDRALPDWPTFDINLRDADTVSPREFDNSEIVRDNKTGIEEWWTRFDRDPKTGNEAGPAKQLGGFLAALVFTAKDWHDNMQLRVPGYRDRVVHVKMTADEGGLNLSMPADRIERLGERGRLAAWKLGERFSPAGDGSPMTWDNHRWIRFRNTFSLIEQSLRDMRETIAAAHEPGRTSYETLIRSDPLPSYGMGDAHREACLAWIERMMNDPFLDQKEHTFDDDHAPRPRPELRIVPKI